VLGALLLVGVLAACSGSIGPAPIGSAGAVAPPPSAGPGTAAPAKEAPKEASPAPSAAAVAIPAVTRLTSTQYANAVATVFGAGIGVRASDLPPDEREDHFRSMAAAKASVSSSHIEAYFNVAYDVSAQLFGRGEGRAALVGCTPAGIADRACAARYLSGLSRRLWRRPVSDAEIAPYVDGAISSAARFDDSWKGLEEATAALLLSPRFLMRIEEVEPDPGAAGRLRFDGYAMASRLSFLLLDTTPNDDLLSIAEQGALATAEGVRAAAQKLSADGRARKVLARLLSELLDVEALPSVMKDEDQHPLAAGAFGASLAKAAGLFVEHLTSRGTSWKELLTSRDLFVDAALARIYELKAPSAGFAKVTLPDTGVRLGFLGQAPFLALHAGPVETSPIHRGLMIRRTLLCGAIPEPPSDVDTKPPAPPPGVKWTTRERSEQIMKTAPCGACHTQMDPLGFAFEGLDAIGRVRARDGEKPVNTATELDGTAVSGPAEMAVALAAKPEFGRCAATQLFRFANGVAETAQERRAIEELGQELGRRDARVEDVLVQFLASDLFRRPAGSR
jgi:hypothetical protein